MPKSITFSSRMRRCSASISGTSSVRSVWVASIRSSHWLGPAVALIRAGGQRVHQPLQLDVGVAECVGVDEVFGELTGQPQHHRGHGGRGLLGVEMPG